MIKKFGLIESIAYLKSVFDKFLDYYHIGRVREFVLKKKQLYISINLRICCRSGMDDDMKTRKLKYEKQIQILKELGLQMEEKLSKYMWVPYRTLILPTSVRCLK